MGVEVKRLEDGNAVFLPDYETLRSSAASDPNALVLGLLDLHPDGLRAVRLNDLSLMGPPSGLGRREWLSVLLRSYPLSDKEFLYTRRTLSAQELREMFLRRMAEGMIALQRTRMERGALASAP